MRYSDGVLGSGEQHPAPSFPRMWWELMEGVGWLQVSSGGMQTPEGMPHLPGGARPDPARTCLCFLTSRSFQQARVIAIVQSGLTEELERAEQWPLIPLGLSSDRAQPILASQFRFPDPHGHSEYWAWAPPAHTSSLPSLSLGWC